jgi:hypothetical protein
LVLKNSSMLDVADNAAPVVKRQMSFNDIKNKHKISLTTSVNPFKTGQVTSSLNTGGRLSILDPEQLILNNGDKP